LTRRDVVAWSEVEVVEVDSDLKRLCDLLFVAAATVAATHFLSLANSQKKNVLAAFKRCGILGGTPPDDQGGVNSLRTLVRFLSTIILAIGIPMILYGGVMIARGNANQGTRGVLFFGSALFGSLAGGIAWVIVDIADALASKSIARQQTDPLPTASGCSSESESE
jgi:hypothetical protein